MQRLKLFSTLLLLTGFAVSAPAFADRGHGGYRGHGGHGGHLGVELYLGAPYYPYPYYPHAYPYVYPYNYYPPTVYPPTVIIPDDPPVYIEQGDTEPPQQAPADNYYWYHCDKPDGYYPYIKECPAGWEKVAPTPPSQ